MPIVRTIRPPGDLLSSEHVLTAGANFAPVAVRFYWRLRRRVVARGAPMNTALEAEPTLRN
jgi:hypothetical protein